MRIWDVHCHPPGGENLTRSVDATIAAADRMGIERLGLIMILDDNDAEVEQVLTRRRDRILGYIWLSLWDTPVERNLALLNRWLRDGPAVGIKLGGWSGFPQQPRFQPVFRHAASLGTVILIHTWSKVGNHPPRFAGGNLPNEPTPSDVAELARNNPDIPLILGHTGGDWELGIRAVRARKNVSVDLSGGLPVTGEVEMAVRELGARRVMFGSDFAGRGFASQLAKVYDAEVSDSDRELIFSGNLRRMAAPILRRKGMEVGA
ncbi:MAG: amidohydrolase family protein [Acidobacteria bacterium]|nr:amidohydrolase family protein [Acidobacteriota bacterium]